MMKKKLVKKAAETALQAVRPHRGDNWKCVAFLLIGVIGGYLLSPAKGVVLIGSFNGSRLKMPVPPMPPHDRKPPHKKPEKPLKGAVVIGSFNGCSAESAEEEEK
jgi:hypothetical protein